MKAFSSSEDVFVATVSAGTTVLATATPESTSAAGTGTASGTAADSSSTSDGSGSGSNGAVSNRRNYVAIAAAGLLSCFTWAMI